MSLDTDLRTEIISASTTLGTRVHQNFVSQQQAKTLPRCWFGRSSTDDVLDLDGTRGALIETQFDVEVIDDDADGAITAANAIRTTLNGKYGNFGASTIKGCFVEDQDDQYVPRGTGEDAGLHVTALRLRIFST